MSAIRSKRRPTNRLSYLQSKAAKHRANQTRAQRYNQLARRPAGPQRTGARR